MLLNRSDLRKVDTAKRITDPREISGQKTRTVSTDPKDRGKSAKEPYSYSSPDLRKP